MLRRSKPEKERSRYLRMLACVVLILVCWVKDRY